MLWFVSKAIYEERRDELREARKEIQRLTDIIVQMRHDKFTLGPEHSDQRWDGGKYVMGEEEDEEPQEVATYQNPPLSPDAADEMLEQQIQRDLERALNED